MLISWVLSWDTNRARDLEPSMNNMFSSAGKSSCSTMKIVPFQETIVVMWGRAVSLVNVPGCSKVEHSTELTHVDVIGSMRPQLHCVVPSASLLSKFSRANLTVRKARKYFNITIKMINEPRTTSEHPCYLYETPQGRFAGTHLSLKKHYLHFCKTESTVYLF